MAAKVTLITGCSSGIGLALAARLAGDQAKNYIVYATMRNLKKRDELEKAARDHVDKTLFIRELDVKNRASVQRGVQQVIEEQGRVDALVNNAGIAGFNALEYMEHEEIEDIVDTNFMGSLRMIKEVLPHMKERRAGRIINVSSLSGLFGYPFYEVYCSSKFATQGLIDSLASRLHEFNISLCSLNPGPVTSMINDNIRDGGRLPDKQRIDDVTKRQLKLVGRYQRYHFEDGVAQTTEDMAYHLQQVLEMDNPPLWNMTRKYCYEKMPYRYNDITGLQWVNHKRRLVEMPGVDIDELRRKDAESD
ncbi:retinol dehydrogenase 8-like [Diadema setosum]|uniref:retinol dehydrogenase 8-like n=1 Tax=Diadema setosum TaxID=31175 RepID=UPI003B3B1AD7